KGYFIKSTNSIYIKSMRSIEEGETAINDGCKVLGFGFMDTVELGQRIAQAFLKKYPRS
ncbi:hypothetical protein GASC598I20_002640, partial [Gilliamella apicola SCGC AB-598-I20]